MQKQYCVYILTNKRNGTLYTGVTGYLVERTWEHKEKLVPGFTEKYGIGYLVWYEVHASPDAAIIREKQIKKWKRAWKVDLIENFNPAWSDLYPQICA